jgi:hypothetical protein
LIAHVATEKFQVSWSFGLTKKRKKEFLSGDLARIAECGSLILKKMIKVSGEDALTVTRRPPLDFSES